MNLFSTPFARFKSWISASIRRKLTFFVVLVCFMLISLVFLLVVQLLQPAYNASIQRDLTRTLNTVVSVLDKAAQEEVPLLEKYSSQGLTTVAISDDCITLLNDQILSGNLKIENLCIDISDKNLNNVFLWDQLPSRCLLHKNEGLLGEVIGRNGDAVLTLRDRVFKTGSVYYEQDLQMISGKIAANGEFAVIISMNLERIPQAVGVLQQLMIVVSIAMILLSVLCAYIFSNWFTKPLTDLSGAARQVSKGNYNVSVSTIGRDEIATLAKDFNTMAQEVKRSDELQKDLIANVSHDLRTPLTLIKGYAETLRDLTGDDPVKREEQLNVIVDESDRLSALVGSVLELSRMSSGNEKIEKVHFNLTQLCDEVGYRYDVLAHQRNLNFVFEGEDKCDIYADPALLERALHNLLGNAVNHVGPDGYIGLRVVKIDDGKRARVEVIDHGPGIPADELELVFKRYYRSRASAGKPGTGLGLSITKAILENHGYTFGVNSTLGQGCVFWFEAPLDEGPVIN